MPVLEKYQSTHHQRDPETQYDHRNARNSDSDDGRFLGVDAVAAKYPSLSPYAYVGGNPIRVAK
jgi:RHS repeat-associated protein